MVDPAQLERVFFAAVAERAADDRASLLDEACHGNLELRGRVEALLLAHTEAGGFLGLPQEATVNAEYAPLHEQPGSTVGRYKLLQQIGEGGFGVVFMAVQERPIHRRVAIKVIKPGMESRQVVARFEVERQALAMMDHPHIAKAFDAGTTQSGRPYFVMELIRGVPITEFCDAQGLAICGRLELFVQICRAVQHAHHKGIIHRDLKPSNVLVTWYDDQPHPKVIDFGVAKALEGRLTDRTLLTGFHQFVGTPTYMSPEQARFSGLDVDTRSDIYSLGVMLYELLTGTTPFESKDTSLDEMRRMICDVDPPTPSARLATFDDDIRTRRAETRGLDPKRYVARLRGELDWIVMRCLEKDRTRRYASASALALDLERFLAQHPIEAGPPSLVYRLGKFARRHTIGLSVGVAALLLLVVGVAGLVVSNSRIRSEQQRTLQALDDATAARRESDEALADMTAFSRFLVEDVLSVARPAGQRGGVGIDVRVKEALDLASANLASRFEGRPRAEAIARHDLGVTYRLVGDYARAEEHLRRGLELRRQALGASHADTLNTINSLAVVVLERGDVAGAIALSEECCRGFREQFGERDPRTHQAMRSLARGYMRAGRLAEAVPMLERVLRLEREEFGDADPSAIGTLQVLAIAYEKQGDLQQAIANYEEALERHRARYGADHPDTLHCLESVAMAWGRAGRSAEGLPLAEEVVRRRQVVLGPTHPSTLKGMQNLAMLYQLEGRLDDALSLYEQATGMCRETLGPAHRATLCSMGNLADFYRQMGRLSEAIELFDEVLKKWDEHHPAAILDRLYPMNNLVLAYADAGRLAEAQALGEEVLRLRRQLNGPDHPDTLTALNNVAVNWARTENWDKALPLMEESLEVYRRKLGPAHPSTVNATWSLCAMYRQTGQSQKGLPIIEEVYKQQCEKRGAEHAETLALALLLGATLIDLEDFKAAEPLLKGCQAAIDAGRTDLNSLMQQLTREQLIRLYEAWGKPDQANEWRSEPSSKPPETPREAA